MAKRLHASKCHLVWRWAQPRGLCVRWGPSPLSKKGRSPQFSAQVYCGQTAAWIKMSLGTELGLGNVDLWCYRPSFCLSSVVCLSSVTFVRPTQAVQIFGNISAALGTLAWPSIDIHWKFHGDRPRGTPPPRELNTKGVAKYSDRHHACKLFFSIPWWSQDIFPRQRHLPTWMSTHKTSQDVWDQAETRRDWDIIQMLETWDIARHRQQDIRRAKTLRITLKWNWDAFKMFEAKTLPMYSYRDTL